MRSITIEVNDADAEYLLAWVHLTRAESALRPHSRAPVVPPAATEVYDFLPPAVETRIIEAVAQAVSASDG